MSTHPRWPERPFVHRRPTPRNLSIRQSCVLSDQDRKSFPVFLLNYLNLNFPLPIVQSSPRINPPHRFSLIFISIIHVSFLIQIRDRDRDQPARAPIENRTRCLVESWKPPIREEWRCYGRSKSPAFPHLKVLKLLEFSSSHPYPFWLFFLRHHVDLFPSFRHPSLPPQFQPPYRNRQRHVYTPFKTVTIPTRTFHCPGIC